MINQNSRESSALHREEFEPSRRNRCEDKLKLGKTSSGTQVPWEWADLVGSIGLRKSLVEDRVVFRVSLLCHDGKF